MFVTIEKDLSKYPDAEPSTTISVSFEGILKDAKYRATLMKPGQITWLRYKDKPLYADKLHGTLDVSAEGATESVYTPSGLHRPSDEFLIDKVEEHLRSRGTEFTEVRILNVSPLGKLTKGMANNGALRFTVYSASKAKEAKHVFGTVEEAFERAVPGDRIAPVFVDEGATHLNGPDEVGDVRLIQVVGRASSYRVDYVYMTPIPDGLLDAYVVVGHGEPR